MNCQNCGYNLTQNDQVCPVCGAAVTAQPVYAQQGYDQNAYAQQSYDQNAYAQQGYDQNAYAQPTYDQNAYAQQTYVQPAQPQFDPKTLPEQYRPLSAWAYFGLQLLYGVPIVGFIFLIIFSFNGGNVHRRSHARSQWIGWLIVATILIIFWGVIGTALGAAFGSMRY